MESRKTSVAAHPVVAPRSRMKHLLGFLASGAIAFVADFAVLELLVRFVGTHPLAARIISVASAMFVGWLLHRTLTFGVLSAPTASEFFRYAASASVAALVNYFVYAAVLILWPTISLLGALVAASAVSAIYAYITMRYVVFRSGRNPAFEKRHEG